MSVESPRTPPTLRMPVVVCVLLSLLIGVLRLGRSFGAQVSIRLVDEFIQIILGIIGYWFGLPSVCEWESPLSTIPSTMFQLEIIHGWLEMEAKVLYAPFHWILDW